MSASGATGPLSGVRILDLTRALAGPFCTMLLGDLGADILKVEAPDGDMTRTLGPFPPDRKATDYGAYFAAVNRNKRSIVLDLKNEDDKQTLLSMVTNVDALVENFRPAVMDRLGLPYEDLRKANPKLVYAAVRGFGDPRTGESPYVDWPAFDIVAQSMGGVVASTGEPGSSGVRAGPAVGDVYPGTLAALGVVSAILNARGNGEGQFLDVSMYDAMLTLGEALIYNYDQTGQVHPPSGNEHPSLCPFEVYRTGNGSIAIAAPTDKHWRILAKVIGHEELGRHPDYKDTAARVKSRDTIRDMIEGWGSDKTTAQVVEHLAGQVPVGPVNTSAEIFEDPHIAARNMLEQVDYPGSDRPITMANPSIKLTDTPAGIYRRAPHLGEHTEEILSELGIKR
jgi:crotonobetainyl-CoA:carnitine CoA-transferase CaiB-like acyl-CoA transferase